MQLTATILNRANNNYQQNSFKYIIRWKKFT